MNRDAAKSIFLDLLDIPQHEHVMYLDRVCGGDPELRDRVESLLHAHKTADVFMCGEPSGVDVGTADAPDAIGPYRVVEQLGEGGFGRVYLCEQDEPIARRVAVKILHESVVSSAAARRFEDERVLLARMDHPGIARVLDAGRADGGRQYIVMEYVQGETLTSYCDTHRLGINERVGLAIQVCRAVQHAHQKGVIHRDLKPSNILVTEVDGESCVKVIDFGVSKAFGDEDDALAGVTLTRQLVGTPQYMSPEQATGGARVLDTRSDVYALGVLVYELLCGFQPFDAEQLRSASASQLEKLIREVDPVRPSIRLSQVAEGELKRICEARDVSSSRLIHDLRGELDWITMRAMEKDPERRYATCNALADDLQRGLDGEAVLAGPPGMMYRARRFVVRRRVPVLIGLVLVGIILAIGMLSAVHAVQLRAANVRISETLEDREQIIRFTEEMLGGVDPAMARGRDTQMFQEILDSASAKLASGFEDVPRVEVRLRILVGSLYRSIGSFDEAAAHFERAVTLSRDSLGSGEPMVIEALSSLGSSYVELSRFTEAREVLEEASRLSGLQFGGNDENAFVVRSNLAAVYSALGMHTEAIDSHRALLEDRVRVLGDQHVDTMATRNNLANALRVDELNEEAGELFERVLAFQLEALGEDHPNTLKTRTNLALVYAQLGDLDSAVRMNRDIYAQKLRVLGERHPSVLVTMVNLASALEKQGGVDEARTLLEHALAISEADLGDLHQYTLTIRNNLAGLLNRIGAFEQALPYQRASYEGLREVFGDEHPTTVVCGGNYVRLLLNLDRAEEAAVVAEETLRFARAIFEDDDARLCTPLERYVQASMAAGVGDDVAQQCQHLLRLCLDVYGPESVEAVRARQMLDQLKGT